MIVETEHFFQQQKKEIPNPTIEDDDAVPTRVIR